MFDTKCFPPHQLFLKVGKPVIIIPNTSVAQDICNSKRMVVSTIPSHICQCKILPCSQKGDTIGIPCIRQFIRVIVISLFLF